MFGAESLVKMMLSAIGLEPETAQRQLLELQQWIINSIKSFDSRLRAQESNTREMMRKQDLILSHLGVNDGRQQSIESAGTESAVAGTESAAGHDAN